MMAWRRLTGNVLRVTVPPRIARLAHTRVRPVGVEAPPVVTRTGTTRTFDHILGTPGTSETRRARAGVARRRRVVRHTPTPVTTRLRRAVVLVGTFRTWETTKN